MTVAIITPLHNEEGNIAALMGRIGELVRTEPGYSWVWVAVDDGSTDGTVAQIEKDVVPYPVEVIRLSRNFGQQAALMAGLMETTADALVFLDGDLQDPPEVISDMLRQWESGAEIVVAQRRSRREPLPRRLLIGGFHVLFHRLTGSLMPSDSGNFGLMTARVAGIVRTMSEHSLYLPALRAWAGFRQVVICYDRLPRARGEGLSIPRLFAFAWDAIVGFSEAPLRMIAALGVGISVLSFGYGTWLLIQRILQFFGFFKELEVLGFTTVAVSVFFMGGVQLVCLGVIGEYLARVYREVKGRPRYVIERKATLASGRGTK